MRIYITKWALSRGIVESEAVVGNDRSGVVFLGDGKMFMDYEYKTTYTEAVYDFERQKAEELERLKEKIKRLRARKPKLVRSRCR